MAKVAKRRGRYVLDFYDQHGRRQWVTLPKGTNREDAQDRLLKIQNRLARGSYVPHGEVPKFKNVGQDWLETKKDNLRASTWKAYEGHLKNHFNMVDELRVNQITVAVVEKFMAERRRCGMILPTLKKVMITFGQVMRYAARHKLIDHNPVPEAERPRGQGREVEKRIAVLKPAEIRRLIDAEANQKYKMLFTLAAMSGARQGELLGLKWSDVLWGSGQIQIRRTYNNRAWYRPKSKTSERNIDLGPAVMRGLKEWRFACPRTADNLIFPGELGGPMDQTYMKRHHFRPALKAAGLPPVRFHDLRHSFASILIEQREGLPYIQKQLGHSKPSVTLDIYAHLFDDHNPEAAGRLEAAVLGAGKTEPAKYGSEMVATG